MAITTQIRTDLRTDMGMPDDETVFSDDAMSRIWDRVAGATSEANQMWAAKGLMAEQLLNQGTRLHDYSLVNSSEKLSQIRANLKDMYKRYESALLSSLGTQDRQLDRSALRPLINEERRSPRGQDEGFEDTNGINSVTFDHFL